MYGLDGMEMDDGEGDGAWTSGDEGADGGYGAQSGYGDEEEIDNEGGFRSTGRRNGQQIRSDNFMRNAYQPSNGSSYQHSSRESGRRK